IQEATQVFMDAIKEGEDFSDELCFLQTHSKEPARDSDVATENPRSGHKLNTAEHGAKESNIPTHVWGQTLESFQFAQPKGRVNPNWILLDSQATCNCICNPRLLRDIREHPDGERIRIHCNAGSVLITKVGDLPGFGRVWYQEGGLANVLSLGLVSDSHRVTLDTAIAQSFFVHKQDGTTRRFDRMPCGLYACDLTDTSGVILTVTTVKGQKQFYSDLDLKRAKTARKLQETLGFPSVKAYLHMIDNNLIMNCPVTRRDVLMAEDIYGVNTNIVKGKTVRRRPTHTREDIEPVPAAILKRYRKVTLGIDVYTVNGIKFFRSISRHINFRTSRTIPDAKMETLLSCVKSTIGLYAARGFVVVQLMGDNEFNCLKDPLLELSPPVKFHGAAPNAHEPFIERDNRTSKEQVRCTFASVPFKAMPPRMIIELVNGVDYWLNYWCNSSGVSTTISPRQLLTGTRLDAQKHCKFQFGDYVLGHEESGDNSMDPRARDAIYLRPTGDVQGAMYLFDLATQRRIRRKTATLAHMTDTVIRRVEEIARKQNSPDGLIYGDAHGQTTIMDIDTDSLASDEDASDCSFVPSDDTSIASDLSGVDSTADEITVGADDEGTMVSSTDESNCYNESSGLNADTDTLDDRASTARRRILQRRDNTENTNQPGAGTTKNPGPDTRLQETGETEVNKPNSGNDLSVSVNHANNEAPNERDEQHDTDDDSRTGDSCSVSSNCSSHKSNCSENESNDHGDQADSTGPAAQDTTEDEGEDSSVSQEETNTRVLRPRVTRAHNKFGSADGFTPSVHHRTSSSTVDHNCFFTVGFREAVNRVSKQHEQYMFIAAAIAKYNNIDASLVTKQYGVKAGLKIFGTLGVEAVLKELRQLHDREVVSPVHIRDLTGEEIKRALPYLMFLKRKRCGTIKGRGCADGRSQREFISKEDSYSPTVSLHALMLSCLIDAIEGRDVATADIPGAFLQTPMPPDEVVHLRFDGPMADILTRLDPKLYQPHLITTKKGHKMLYARADKAIYGTLRAAIQISHESPEVVTHVLKLLEEEFGQDAPLTVTRGRIHDYVGMTIDYTEQGKVIFNMFDYVEGILSELPESLNETRITPTPASSHLFQTREDDTLLSTKDGELFHHFVAQLLFASKRARPDLQTAIAFLCTRVASPGEDDWKKLRRVMGYLRSTAFVPLVLGWDGSGQANWYVDASFAVHTDMKSHTGAMLTFGQGAVMAMSTKQKLNTKSSTEAELVGVDDALPYNLWLNGIFLLMVKPQVRATPSSPHAFSALLVRIVM
ncbi:unnamed protein product, partial [Pseudo-nitzschia multistriata]